MIFKILKPQVEGRNDLVEIPILILLLSSTVSMNANDLSPSIYREYGINFISQ